MAKPTVRELEVKIKPKFTNVETESKNFIEKFGLTVEKDGSKVFTSFFGENFSKAAKSAFGKMTTEQSYLKYLKQSKADLKAVLPFASDEEKKEIEKALNQITEGIKDSEANKIEKLEKMKENVKNTLNSFGGWIKRQVKDFFMDVLKAIPETLNEMSTYNVGSSIFGTSTGRETMLQWGLSEGQAYAFDKTKEILGISSEEDLWYMNANQREKFAELIGRYNAKYDELAQKDLLKSYEEFKLEFMLLKEDLTYDLIQIIVDNKDTIKWFLETGVQVFKGLMNFLGLVTGTKSYTTSDLMTTYNSSNVSNSKSYNLNNTFNISGSSAQQAQQYSAAMTNIINQLKGS